jgi:hypothetical protein
MISNLNSGILIKGGEFVKCEKNNGIFGAE